MKVENVEQAIAALNAVTACLASLAKPDTSEPTTTSEWLKRRCWLGVHAYEQSYLYPKHGRRVAAGRTRYAISRVGERARMITVVGSNKYQAGLIALRDAGRLDASWEQAIIDAPASEGFSPELVANAKRRLAHVMTL